MTIYLFIAISLLSTIGFNGSKVTTSLYALDLGADQFTIGILVALYAVCPMLLSIAIGKFVDRGTPRLLSMAGVAGLGLALTLPALFPGLATLYVSSLLLGFFNQLAVIPIESSAGRIGGSENRARNFALLSMGFSAAGFLGPVIAGFAIDAIGQPYVFLVLAAFSATCLPILWLRPGLMPRGPVQTGETRHGSFVDLLRIPHLRTTFIAGGIFVSTWDLFMFYFPIYGHKAGLSASAIGTIMGMVALATFTIRGVLPFFIKKLPENEILAFSIFTTAFAFLLLPFFSDPFALAAVAFLLGLGFGCGTPILMSLVYAMTPPGRIAESTGMRKTVNQTTHIAVPLLFGSIGAAFGFTTVFMLNTAVLVFAGLLMRRARGPDTSGR